MKRGKYTKVIALIRYPVMLLGVTAMSIAIASGFYARKINTVIICDNGTLIEVTTSGRTVGDALNIAGIVLNGDEYINYNKETVLSNLDMIEIERPVTLSVNVEGKELLIKSYSDSVSKALEENNIEITARDIVVGGKLDEVAEEGMNLSVIRIDEEYDIEKITLDYETQYVASEKMLKGTSAVINQGRVGIRTLIYRVIKEDGVEISRELVSDTITQNPIKQVIAYGTIANFTNSRGQIVSYKKSYNMVATAYYPDAKWGHAVHMPGKKARVGVIAVDPSVIPLGTKVYVEGINGSADYGFAVAWDTGSSIKNMKIDLFMNTIDECFNWGMRNVKVYILEDQSVDIFALRG